MFNLGTYICKEKDQLSFAELSGDFNPLHINNDKSRRFLFGQSVMHGIHILMRGLDLYKSHNNKIKNIKSLDVKFDSPVYINDQLIYKSKKVDSQVIISALKNNELVARFNVCFDNKEKTYLKLPKPKDLESSSLRLNAVEIANSNGSFDLSLDKKKLNDLFPNLSSNFNYGHISVLLASTKLVGMICPGLNSIYSELSLYNNKSTSRSFDYNVKSFKKRYAMVKIDVSSFELSGSITAFHRPEPSRQRSFSNIIKKDHKIKIKKALVVGGSRGLGEACAKVLAAYGSEVVITYHTGEVEARAIVDEISSGGGKASCIKVDINNIDEVNIDNIDGLFYFASPPIFVAKKGIFNTDIFETFNQYYINGFKNVFNSLNLSTLNYVFYPSSVAIDEVPLFMGEYVSSKIAGEALCRFLGKKHSNIIFESLRLPRLASDQTMSLLPVINKDPVTFFENHLNKMFSE